MTSQGLRSIVYYTNWSPYGRAFHPQSLSSLASPTNPKLTHILYAFANLSPATGHVTLTDPWSDTDKHYPPHDTWDVPAGTTNVYGCIKQLFLLKKQNRHLKVLLSIGGWTYSSNFAQPAGTLEGRRNFATSAVKLLEDLGFDGIDVDWEYPKDTKEGGDFVELLREVRKELNRAEAKRNGSDRARFLLSVACPAAPRNIQNLMIREMDEVLDFWNLMAYDFAGSWDRVAAHQTNLFPARNGKGATPFSTDEAVWTYVGRGVRPDKIVLGMPLYGRAFMNTDGPGKGYEGVGEGSWENGVWDQKVLPKEGAREYWDEETGASWSYDSQKRVMVTYDNEAAVKRKARYVLEKGLGGGMWWEASGDRSVGEGSMVETFVDAVGGKLEQSRNTLEYKESKYDNLRDRFPGEGE